VTVGRDVHSLRSSVISVLDHFGPHKIWYIVIISSSASFAAILLRNLLQPFYCATYCRLQQTQLPLDTKSHDTSCATYARHCRPCVIALSVYVFVVRLQLNWWCTFKFCFWQRFCAWQLVSLSISALRYL